MARYGGYLLASILSVWTVILAVVIMTWLRERKFFS